MGDVITRPGYLWCADCREWHGRPIEDGQCPECGEPMSEEGEMEDQE